MDLIERQAAVDAITSYNGIVDKSVAKRILIQLPPEQSEHVADIDKNDLISRQEAIELKPEFLNPNVNRETEEKTAIDRAYARGWNSCNTHWIDGISGMPSALQAQDCKTCKHDPPSKKWPCIDCDMREPADRWESRTDETRRSD